MSGPQSSLRSVLLVSICSVGQLIVQFGFQVLLAHLFGAGAEMDAYMSAIALPTVVSSVLVGSLGYAFVPAFIERLEKEGSRAAWSMATRLGLLLIVFAVAVSVLGSMLARPLMQGLHPGFSPAQVDRTAALFQVLAWLMLTNSLISFLQALHHCQRRYLVTAVAPIAGTAVTLVFAFLFHEQGGMTAIVWAVLLGSVVNVLVQAPPLLGQFRYTSHADAGTWRWLSLMVPLVLGAAYFKLDPLVDRYLASGLPTGSISHLGYAWRLSTALLMVGTGGLSIVAFPVFAGHSAAGRRREFLAEIAHALRFQCFLIVPMALGILCFSRPVVRDLFERGMFTASDTEAVAMLLVMYLGVIVAASFGEITAKIFYSLADTRTPTIIGVCGFTLGVGLKFALTPVAGVAGIVIATSVYRLLNATTMIYLIRRRLGPAAYAGIAGKIMQSVLGSLPALVAAYLVLQIPLPFLSPVAAGCGAVVYLLCMAAQRDEFALKLCRFLTRRRS